jgi:hypothetical protein
MAEAALQGAPVGDSAELPDIIIISLSFLLTKYEKTLL